MDLCQVNPEFNLYDPEWPMRTWQPQAPPAKFVFADEGQRCGQALDSIISTGCIISGSRVSGSILCPNVRVHSFCTIEQSILMPGVRVGRHSRIRRAIIDRDVFIPRGACIGFHPEEDRKRHTVTETGHRRRHHRRRAAGRRSVADAARRRRRVGPARQRLIAKSENRQSPASLALGAVLGACSEPLSLNLHPRGVIREHQVRRRTGNSRFAGQPDGRSRCRARRRRLRARRGALGRLDRHPRGARAARRRQEPLSRQGRAHARSAT